ncbi:unannotated protein [freshwater metagenome]|uniref:Unannotated protein n=1 Tax=freshwater metagenome TaxID=449393 RepID=A0A6J7AIV6_9ZZZZ
MAGGALQRSSGTDEVRSLLSGEAEEGDVLGGVGIEAVDVGVHRLRVGLGDDGEAVTECEADREYEAVAIGGEGLEVRLTVFGGGRLELVDRGAEFLGGLVGTAGGGVVERTVAASAGVECEADLEVGVRRNGGTRGVASGGRRGGRGLVIAARSGNEAERGDECDRSKTLALAHVVSP